MGKALPPAYASRLKVLHCEANGLRGMAKCSSPLELRAEKYNCAVPFRDRIICKCPKITSKRQTSPKTCGSTPSRISKETAAIDRGKTAPADLPTLPDCWSWLTSRWD